MRHLISIGDVDRATIEHLLERAAFYAAALVAKERINVAAGKLLATLFYEPSTRTRLSFEAAMQRLGGGVLSVADAKTTSSAKKGETIADSVRVVSGYADVIVQRHPAQGSAQEAASASGVPVINAGDGTGEHPSQALLDLYTLKQARGKLDGLHVVMAGDLKYGRTVHSLARALSCFDDVAITLISPDALRFPAALRESVAARGVTITETEDLASAAQNADALYMTRIQQERFADPADYEQLKGSYVIDAAFVRAAGDITIMHPLPRVDEIAPDVDNLPNAAYFRQAHNGVPVRMALLAWALELE